MASAGHLRILLDECVQAAVVRALVDDGHDVVRPVASGTIDSLSDEAVLELAVGKERILVTTDMDRSPFTRGGSRTGGVIPASSLGSRITT